MTCGLVMPNVIMLGAKPFSEPMLTYFHRPLGTNLSEILSPIQAFLFKKNAFENVCKMIPDAEISLKSQRGSGTFL